MKWNALKSDLLPGGISQRPYDAQSKSLELSFIIWWVQPLLGVTCPFTRELRRFWKNSKSFLGCDEHSLESFAVRWTCRLKYQRPAEAKPLVLPPPGGCNLLLVVSLCSHTIPCRNLSPVAPPTFAREACQAIFIPESHHPVLFPVFSSPCLVQTPFHRWDLCSSHLCSLYPMPHLNLSFWNLHQLRIWPGLYRPRVGCLLWDLFGSLWSKITSSAYCCWHFWGQFSSLPRYHFLTLYPQQVIRKVASIILTT